MLEKSLGRNKNPEKAKYYLIEAAPLKKIGNPEDVSKLALFLADNPKSGNITDMNLFVTKGSWQNWLQSEMTSLEVL